MCVYICVLFAKVGQLTKAINHGEDASNAIFITVTIQSVGNGVGRIVMGVTDKFHIKRGWWYVAGALLMALAHLLAALIFEEGNLTRVYGITVCKVFFFPVFDLRYLFLLVLFLSLAFSLLIKPVCVCINVCVGDDDDYAVVVVVVVVVDVVGVAVVAVVVDDRLDGEEQELSLLLKMCCSVVLMMMTTSHGGMMLRVKAAN